MTLMLLDGFERRCQGFVESVVHDSEVIGEQCFCQQAVGMEIMMNAIGIMAYRSTIQDNVIWVDDVMTLFRLWNNSMDR